MMIKKFHIEPKITIGQIVTGLLLLVGFVSGYIVLTETVRAHDEDLRTVEARFDKYVPRPEIEQVNRLILRELQDIKEELRRQRRD